jgi:hypothetical protein
MEINIKLNIELFMNTEEKMDKQDKQDKHDKHEYYMLYLRQEMSNGLNEFQASVKFLMDENIPQKYKDLYRKKHNQVIQSMDIDEYLPKLVKY